MLMMKKDGENRIKGNRDVHERKRNLLIMIAHHLVNQGYIETASTLQREISINLENFEVADNMDLYYVLQDFESYFEIRFNKKPKLVKKLADGAGKKGMFTKKPPMGAAKKPSNDGSKSSKNSANKPNTGKETVKRSQSTAADPLSLEGK